MKHAIWFVRLVFAAWMLPAGLNHFVPLFPQPLGNMPLSRELFSALYDSHLFDLVKAVELFAGIAVLTGFQVPLALIMCMPVAFCVFYWDAPLQGWGSVSAIYGWAVLICNLLLCLAYVGNYRALFVPRSPPQAEAARFVLLARLLFGAWMVLSGVNFFLAHAYAMPIGHEPLAAQLMTALADSRLLDVAIAVQLIAGLFILGGVFVPLALCIVMPVSVCAAYWAVILEHEPLGAALALGAVALNAGLMLAWLRDYRGALQRHALALGERAGEAGNYEALYVRPIGRTAQGAFLAALIPLALTAALYHFLIFGRTGMWCMLALLYPAAVLHARRLRDMGATAWLLLIPAVPIAAGVWLHMFSPPVPAKAAVIWVAIAAGLAFTLWGLAGKSEAGTSRPEPAVA